MRIVLPFPRMHVAQADRRISPRLQLRMGVLADGRVIDKGEFLRQAQARPDAKDLRLHDVVIRIYGETALVGAFVTYRKSDGSGIRTRYSSLFVRRDGRWALTWVQWTRVAAQ